MAQEAALTSPKISIIVPVYKVEPYIHRCLDSIAAQTFADWECILIDDGSPDNSGAICDEYAAKDNRFKVIHQPNKGVSAARNAGLDTARGEWITFIDSDDWVESIMLQELYDAAVTNDAEVVFCGLKISDGYKILNSKIPTTGWMNMPKDLTANMQGPCAKLYLRSALHMISARFPEDIAMAEDMAFTFQVFFGTTKHFGIDSTSYCYYQNTNSAIHNVTQKMCNDELKVIEFMTQKINQENVNEEWKKFLLDRKCRAKNHFILQVKPPMFDIWRETYPDVNDFMMHNFPLHIKLFCFFVSHKLDILAILLLRLKKVYKCLKK